MRNKKRIVRAILYISFAISLALVVQAIVVPLLLPSGSCTNLGGSPSKMDHSFDFLPFWAVPIYLYGDWSCHQQPDSCFFINSNQLPFCIRELFIYLAFSVGLVLFILFPSGLSPGKKSKEASSWLKRNRLVIAGSIALLPMIVDAAVLTALTQWNCSTLSRILTGFLGGLGAAAIYIYLLYKMFNLQYY